ncbi:UNVERIFIED_CONTAM: hypothetical protein NCL1_25897 [Trichonephila clavipes]
MHFSFLFQVIPFHVVLLLHESGCGSLMVKITDSWPAYHDFDPSTTEDSPCREGRCTLNMSTLKRPSVV